MKGVSRCSVKGCEIFVFVYLHKQDRAKKTYFPSRSLWNTSATEGESPVRERGNHSITNFLEYHRTREISVGIKADYGLRLNTFDDR